MVENILKNLAVLHAKRLIKDGCGILDIGGEATNPGSRDIKADEEWRRIYPVLSKIKRKFFISLDTRKSFIMKKGVKNKINLVNDVSGLEYDQDTIKVLKNTNIPFVIHHMQGKSKNNAKKSKV